MTLLRKILVTLILSATRSFVRHLSGLSLPILIIVTFLSLSLLAVFCHSATIPTSYQDSGSCFDLAGRYLKFSGFPYVIDSRLKSYECNWNFQGNTLKDFETWCKYSGLRCGGNPYFVGFDSVWYAGEYMPVKRAEFLRLERSRADSVSFASAALAERARIKADSLANLPPLPRKRVTIEYLEMGRTTAERLGFSYSDFIGSARFFDYNDLFSVTLQALDVGDTSFVYRTYSSQYDSTLCVFWGGLRDRLTSSNVTSSGIVSNNYERESYGLTFKLSGLKYHYEHSTDFEHSISGDGLLDIGVNHIFGTYQYDSQEERGFPFLRSVPVLGFLFRHVVDVHEVRYMFISVYVAELLEDLE